MRDPHVDWLQYRLECAPATTFQNAPPIEHETAAFRMTLRDGQIRFDFKEHHASIEAAQESVADFLRAWEIDVGLAMGPGEVTFAYEDAGVIDRDPPPPGEPQIASVSVSMAGRASVSFTVMVARASYPMPPSMFKVSPTVETLWQRYEGYLAKREPLSSMAYFCLTVVESSLASISTPPR